MKRLYIIQALWVLIAIMGCIMYHGCSSDIWDTGTMQTNITIVQTNINTNSTITIVVGSCGGGGGSW